MISNKKELKEYIGSDNNWLIPNGIKGSVISSYVSYPYRKIKRFLYYLRKQEYYMNNPSKSRFNGFMSLFYERKKNRLGIKLGIEIGPNCFGKGLNIYHIGSIIINPTVRAGDGCSLHGGNCIGNNGLTEGVPRIGNRVDIGYGAVIIGDVEIADDVKIGANAVVNKSILEPGSTVVGVPAKIVKQLN